MLGVLMLGVLMLGVLMLGVLMLGVPLAPPELMTPPPAGTVGPALGAVPPMQLLTPAPYIGG